MAAGCCGLVLMRLCDGHRSVSERSRRIARLNVRAPARYASDAYVKVAGGCTKIYFKINLLSG
jgi:hypothetical protein